MTNTYALGDFVENPYRTESQVDPDCDSGYRRIPTDVFIALTGAPLTAAELKVSLAVYHHSQGFNRESAPIARSTFMQETGLSSRTVWRTIHQLQKKRIVVCRPSGLRAFGKPVNEYLFNLHFDTWQVDWGDAWGVVSQLVKGNATDGNELLSQGKQLIERKKTYKEHPPVRGGDGGGAESIEQQVVDLYNECCPSLPRIQSLTPGSTRLKHLRSRLREQPDLDWWRQLFADIERSDFLTGRIKDFKATFDWIIKPTNLTKIVEGNYTNRKPSQNETRGISYDSLF